MLTGAIPLQPVGTTVKYIVGAWHSEGGPEVFANSGTCTGCVACTDATTGCATQFQYNVIAAPATPLIISEFRWNGTGGASDEFIEIYNNSDADVTVNAFEGSAGFAVVRSGAGTLFNIPNGTVIPARGHYLGCNSTGYSLAAYPAGNGTTATCDATWTGSDAWPLNTGVALFNTANAGGYTLANRLDAVGAAAETDTLYKEGTGVRNLVGFSFPYSYVRRLPGGCIGNNPDAQSDPNCTSVAALAGMTLSGSNPQDTDDNRADFIFVNAGPGLNSTSDGQQDRLGAPGPENLSSPIQRNAVIKASLIDPLCTGTKATPAGTAPTSACSRERIQTSDPTEPNDTEGTLEIRRKFTNNTSANVTRLRFRIVDITTFPANTFGNADCNAPGAACAADLRALSSTDATVPCTNEGGVPHLCPSGTATATLRGTTLEQAAGGETQPNGGGYNTTLAAGTIALATPLAPNASINVRFRLGVQQRGTFRFFINVEALP